MAFMFSDTNIKLRKLYEWGYVLDIVRVDNEEIYVLGNPIGILNCVSDCSIRDDISSIASASTDVGRFFLVMVGILGEDGEEYDYEDPASNTSFLNNNGVIGCMTQYDLVDYVYKETIKDMER